MARKHGPACVERLAQFAGLIPGEIGDSHGVQLMAMRELLDRGYGKAAQLITGDADNPIAIDFRWAPAQEPAPTIEHQQVADETNAVADETNSDEQMVIEWQQDDTCER